MWVLQELQISALHFHFQEYCIHISIVQQSYRGIWEVGCLGFWQLTLQEPLSDFMLKLGHSKCLIYLK